MAKKVNAPSNKKNYEKSITPVSEIDYKDAEVLSGFLHDILRKVNRPLQMDELLRIAHLPRKAKKRVESALYQLQEQGRAVRASKGWASPARVRHTEGVLAVRPSGAGFVSPKRGGADIYIHEESPQAQERITKSNNGIPGPFPAELLHSLRDLPDDPQEQDFTGRRDARGVAFVTIDGRTARDFDDAIHVAAEKDGFRLRVAIADVSHYVRPNTPLDIEARQRGNSCYFPLSVEPMLPEALSNGLCSLKPGVPRLVVVADLDFSASGLRRGAEFYPAVIESRARLTYGQVQRGLLLRQEKGAAGLCPAQTWGERGARPPDRKEEERNLAPVLPMLQEAEHLARLLLERRQERGTLDFDLPEAVYLFNEQGELAGLTARVRHFGHRMIEEFMIAANEAVAEFLEAREIPALYRVHQPPDPDKLAVLADFLARSGLDPRRESKGRLPGTGGRSRAAFTGRDLRRILEQNRGTPGEYLITRLVLRSMMQARYQPENEGHFGLASGCYCHFTSPIRRYADLVVHRALKRALGLAAPGEKDLSQARLEAVAEHINGTERTATEAEREIHKRLSALFLRGREGESFDAVISGVTVFGIFVELPEFLCEGMIRLASLEDDYYDYLENRQELRGRRTGRTFRLGRALRVTLIDVNLGRLELTFVPEASPGAPPDDNSAGSRRLRSFFLVSPVLSV